jgi:hypothetical protein
MQRCYHKRKNYCNTERSVIDCIIICEDMKKFLEEMIIDEDRAHVEPHLSPMEAIGSLCLPMWLHFGHLWPQILVFGPLCSFLASIGTTFGPYVPLWNQLGLNRALIEPYWASIGPYGTRGAQIGSIVGGILYSKI